MPQTLTPIHEVVREHYAERIKNNALRQAQGRRLLLRGR